MNTPKIPLADHLRALLMQATSLSAAQLQAATGKSQASVSLALQQLGTQVHKLGAARSTRYALTQEILGLSASQALLWHGPTGMPHKFGTLTYLSGNRLHVRSGQQEWLTQGQLPWFLCPLKPQGFLGRELGRLRPDFPGDPDKWSLAQTVHFACTHLEDAVGAIEIDHGMGQLIPESPESLDDRGKAFDKMASNIGQSLPTGSSAGGEQPKFVTTVNADWYIVKFSPPRGTPFGERWHQLLHLENLALDVLQNKGISVAQTQVVQTAQRTYLQSQRFDRIAWYGKRHMVAASVVHEEFVKRPKTHWITTCDALQTQNLLSVQDKRNVALCYLFGQCIGNNDMHFSNLSFFVDDVIKPMFIPTPVYDMLPMTWRPDIHQGNLDPSPLREPVLPAGYAAEAALARTWAIDYWQRASSLGELSAELRTLSIENARRLQHGFP